MAEGTTTKGIAKSITQPLLNVRDEEFDNDPLRAPLPASSDTSSNRSSGRLLDRGAAFHQSKGHWAIHRVCRSSRLRRSSQTFASSRVRTWWDDWFHSLAYRPTIPLMLILFVLYAAQVFFFAGVYLGVSKLGEEANSSEHSFCGMDITNRMEALYFSLSTMTTIGYGVSDYYFGECWTPLLLVLLQSCCAIAFQSIAIGLLFQRISRGQKRGKTIIFSDKAVVQRVKGTPYLMFRIGELRRQHLIEVVVRVYCLKHERYLTSTTGKTEAMEGEGTRVETFHFMTRHIKLMYPDETLGPHILMSLPQVVVHKMDESSPLIPSQESWYDENGQSHSTDYTSNSQKLHNFLQDREAEIIVQVEGTDELTGQPLQARHSYRFDDIQWDHTFVSCTQPWTDDRTWLERRRCERRRSGDPVCSVDFAKFHEIVPCKDADFCPYIPR